MPVRCDQHIRMPPRTRRPSSTNAKGYVVPGCHLHRRPLPEGCTEGLSDVERRRERSSPARRLRYPDCRIGLQYHRHNAALLVTGVGVVTAVDRSPSTAILRVDTFGMAGALEIGR